ncbi:hypothetical protein [Arthrobacter glacialis]|uniref:hypothetical protein n=1 Tax=Arthrobacter glacialis TaxID=1664 RepID=UPI000CD49A55|nr:hypothetical protein [Arthrobacter glacialis]POH57019.1 hypothetical protein CVS28_18290 [Arthrobacter glacialis]
MRFDIDLEFSVELPVEDGSEPTVVHGSIKAAGREIQIHTDSAALFRLGSRRNLPAIRDVARYLAKNGITVTVSVPEGTIVSLGAVEVSAFHRLITNSAHILPGRSNTWSTLLKAQTRGDVQGSLIPPGTPLPLAPTFQRRFRLKPTTTHYTFGGGRPRLIFVRDSETWDGHPPSEFNLVAETTLIGSDGDATFVLPELAAVQAHIVHRDDDEYVFFAGGPDSPTGRPQVLRTGARLVLGPWRLVFFREEYADHGRPFGGRSAGEFARPQRPQFDPRRGQLEYDAVAGVGDSRQPQ